MKRGKHPTTSRKNQTKKVKQKYSKAREDAQLAGVIPTEPVGAVRPEAVDPRSQGEAALPELVRQALRESWATPDAAKPAIIAALLEPFFRDDVVVDEKGNQVRVRPSRKLLMELAKTLRMLDQTQYERDHPSEAGRARGGTPSAVPVSGGTVIGTVNVTVNTRQEAVRLLNEMINDPSIGLEDCTPPHITCPSGNRRHEREVEAGTPPESHQP